MIQDELGKERGRATERWREEKRERERGREEGREGAGGVVRVKGARGGSWPSRGSSVDGSCPPTCLKSTLFPPVPTCHHHPLTAGVTAYRFARPPTAETTRVGTGRGWGGSRVGGRTIFVRPLVWGGGASRFKPVRDRLSPPSQPVGPSKPCLLAYDGGRGPRPLSARYFK